MMAENVSLIMDVHQDHIEEVIVSDDFTEFETNIDEGEAISDLQDLVLSDDELFVDLSAQALRECEPDSMPTEQLTNPRYTCEKCNKQYKRIQFFEKHKNTCTGNYRKRLTKPKATNKKRSATSSAGEA